MNARVSAVASRTFSALRIRNYRLYFLSQAVSFSGTWMQLIAQSWLVLELTGSGTALGTVMATQFLPTLLLAPYGGMIADRVDKRRLIMCTQSAAGALATLLGVLTLTGVVELWMVYAVAAGFGLVTAIDNPSRHTFVMEMVGPADISNAVTLNSVVINGAQTVGPALGGVMIAWVGIGQCFIANGVSYLAVVTAMILIRPGELHPSPRAPRAPNQLREGFRYAWHTPAVRTPLVMMMVIGTMTYEFPTTLPVFADFTFGSGASGLALMTSLLGGGAVVGGLVVASTGTATPRRLAIVAAAFGISVCVLAVMPTLTLACLVLPFVGAACVGTIALSNALLQLAADPSLRGRVMSLFSVALLGSTPIGGPIVGWIAEHVGPRWSLLVGGIAAMGAAAFGWRVLVAGKRGAAATDPEPALVG